jgi:hypothetical protein
MKSPLFKQSPERAALAVLVAEQAARSAADAAAEAGRFPAWQRVEEAEAAVETAKASIEAAKAAAVERIVAGQPDDGNDAVRTARRALADAEDALEIAQAVYAAAKAEQERAQARRGIEVYGLSDAALAVLRASPAIARLAADVAKLQAELYAKSTEIEWLKFYKIAASTPFHAANRFIDAPSTWQGLPQGGESEWQAAFAALKLDADADIPQ